jgi:hypothetical protein
LTRNRASGSASVTSASSVIFSSFAMSDHCLS